MLFLILTVLIESNTKWKKGDFTRLWKESDETDAEKWKIKPPALSILDSSANELAWKARCDLLFCAATEGL